MRTLDDSIAHVHAIADRVTAHEAPRIDRDCAWPVETMAALKEARLTGLVVPREYGGLGLGMRGLIDACERLGYQSGSAGLTFGMHAVGTAVISAKPTSTHVQRLIEPIVAGEHVTTLALSEPTTGSNFWLPRVTMHRTDAGYIIEGTKSFVTNGAMADSYVVSAVSPTADTPVGHFSCLAILEGTPGVSWGDPWRGTGMRGNASATMYLSSVEVDGDALLGEPGEQIWFVFNVIAPYFLTAMTGTYLGIAQRALDETVAGLRARSFAHAAHGPSGFDVVQHRLGALWTQVERTRRLAYWAATSADNGYPEALSALCAAKADVASTVVEAVHEAFRLLGGRAYRDDGLLSRLMRDALAADVMSPTTDLLLTWTGRTLLDLPLLGE